MALLGRMEEGRVANMSQRKNRQYLVEQAKREEEEQIARILQKEFKRLKNNTKVDKDVKEAKLEVLWQYLMFALHKERDIQIVNKYLSENKFEEELDGQER